MINVVTYNVRGLNNPTKRSRLFGYLGRLKADIALIQETHLLNEDVHRMTRKGWMAPYVSCASSKRAGVMILVREGLRMEELGVTSDEGGRYVVVHGRIGDRALTIGSVYAPNVAQNEFLLQFLQILRTKGTGQLIIGGDLNVVWNARMDRSGDTVSSIGTMSMEILASMADLGLRDVWREKHKEEREYTYFSHVHHTRSRIDYLLISMEIQISVEECEIGVMEFSDHAPVWMGVDLVKMERGDRNWRMNEFLLKDRVYCAETELAIRQYFVENTTGEVCEEMVWDAFKATLRGHLIAQSAHAARVRKMIVTEALAAVEKAQTRHQKTNTKHDFKEWQKARAKLNMLLNDKVELQLLRTRQRYYEKGDKPDRLLAHRLKVQKYANYIPALKGDGGDMIRTEKGKKQMFKDFYEALYTAAGTQVGKQREYMQGIELPCLGKEQTDALEQEITLEEVLIGIKTLKVGKSPGPDGIPGTLYKKYAGQLAKPLRDLFNVLGTKGEVTPTMREALIVLIPKPGKDKELCTSYRPISLLNVDVKIYTAILARRLAPLMPHLIHPDQSGFIMGRTTYDNTRKIAHLVEKVSHSKEPSFLVSLDAEKAFDRVDWNFLEGVLEKVGLGPRFRRMILANYQRPENSS